MNNPLIRGMLDGMIIIMFFILLCGIPQKIDKIYHMLEECRASMSGESK